jgi:hypothetical protein
VRREALDLAAGVREVNAITFRFKGGTTLQLRPKTEAVNAADVYLGRGVVSVSGIRQGAAALSRNAA